MQANANKRTKTFYISLGGFGLIIAAFVAFSVVPYLRTTSDLRAQIDRHKSTIELNHQNAAQLKDLTRQVQLVRMEVNNYDRLVPGNQDLGPFLAQLSRELDDAGMADITVRALPPTVLGKCQQLPIQIKGKGTYAQFHRFLTRVESFERMSSVSKLAIEADTTMNGKVLIDLTLSIYNTKPGS